MNEHLFKSTAQGETAAHEQPADSPGKGLKNVWTAFNGKWALAAIVGLLIGLFVGYSVDEPPIPKQSELPSMSQCVTDTLSSFGLRNPLTAEALRDARDHCYSLIQAQGLFNDFAIRKLNFFQQYRANGVLMWMVITVTFSGIFLAGLQLWASYHLARANKKSLNVSDGQLILKRDQLVLKSSITGLFILLISFCFFLVFVFYVYRLDTTNDHANSISPPVPTLPMGALGPAPSGQVKP